VPSLSRAILSHIASDWSAFADVRAAARALSQKSRLANALSIAVNEVRVALAAALLCTDLPGASAESETNEDAESRAEAVRCALRLYSHALAIISDCAEPLAVEWKLSEPQIGKVRQAFESVVGGTGSHPPIPTAPVPTSPPRPEVETFAQSVHLHRARHARRWRHGGVWHSGQGQLLT
jgi:VIT1/CCC1 family predicted Fe2+/Mn2+ transporter